mgnify:CR=1 FL=1
MGRVGETFILKKMNLNKLSYEGWNKVANSTEVTKDRPYGVFRPDFITSLCLWRTRKGSVVALERFCPFRGEDMAVGKIEDDCLVCPNHGIHWDKNGRLKETYTSHLSDYPWLICHSFKTKEINGCVYVWWTSLNKKEEKGSD